MLRLFLALFFACLVTYVGFASANSEAVDCEFQLMTDFSRGTLRLVRRGVIGAPEVAEMIDSVKPIDPLQFRTLGSGDSAAGSFFRKVVPLQSFESWNQVRGELRLIAAKYHLDSKSVAEGRQKTELIYFPLLVETHNRPYFGVSGWTAAGGSLFFIGTNNNRAEVFNILSSTPIWSGMVYNSQTLFKLIETRDGSIGGKFYEFEPQSISQQVLNLGRKEILGRTINFKTGEESRKILYFRGNDPTGSMDLSVIINSLDKFTNPTALSEISNRKVFRTSGGRVLVGVMSDGPSPSLQVIEPEKGTVPILATATAGSNFEFFERDGRIFLVTASHARTSLDSAKVEVYEPLRSQSALASVDIDGFQQFKIFRAGDGKVNLIFIGSQVKVYSLFNTSGMQ